MELDEEHELPLNFRCDIQAPETINDMYLIDRDQNRISPIEAKTFGALGIRERDHLQEWIANNPEVLGEELLVIQKEFAGFHETRERLDLLALDKQGNLVVIENKLDDSGRDVMWQVMKYASYCSSLSRSQIIRVYQEYLDKNSDNKSAEESLYDFFEQEDLEAVNLNQGNTQRIIMVAGDFRKEVTSTVMWLMNYNLRIQCFKVTPYEFAGNHLLNVEQIIPLKEVEEFSISIAEKTKEDINNQEQLKTRHVVRLDFWKSILPVINSKTDLFSNISPSKYGWIGTGSGVRGVTFNLVVSKGYARCELYIDRGDKDENHFVFNALLHAKDVVEEKFGASLVWEELMEKRACRIKYEDQKFNVYDREQWPEIIEFLTESMVRFEAALRPEIATLNGRLKGRSTN